MLHMSYGNEPCMVGNTDVTGRLMARVALVARTASGIGGATTLQLLVRAHLSS